MILQVSCLWRVRRKLCWIKSSCEVYIPRFTVKSFHLLQPAQQHLFASACQVQGQTVMNMPPLPFFPDLNFLPLFVSCGHETCEMEGCACFFEFSVTAHRWILRFYLGYTGPTIPVGIRLFEAMISSLSTTLYFNDYVIDRSGACSITLCTSKWKLSVVIG